MVNHSDENYDVLVFSPFAGINPHAEAEHAISEILSRADLKVARIGCRGLLALGSCHVIGQETGLLADKLVCSSCRRVAQSQYLESSYTSYSIDDFLTQADKAHVLRTVRSLSDSRIPSFEVDSIPIGGYATYVPSVHYKTVNLGGSPEAKTSLRRELISCYFALKSAENILERFKPKLVLVYSFEYGVNRSFLAPFARSGVKTLSFYQTSIPDRRGDFVRFTSASKLESYVTAWRNTKSMKIPLNEIEEQAVSGKVRSFLRGEGSHVYSRPRSDLSAGEVRKRLGLPNSQKCVLVLFSSSDELLAAARALLFDAGPGYKSDTDFLRFAIRLAISRPSVHFVFRLHPRMFPNQRDSLESPEAPNLFAELSNVPVNVRINSPKDNLSLWDVATVSDAVVNHRSSSGVEVGLSGIPVLYFQEEYNPYAVEGLAVDYENEKGFGAFLENLDAALRRGPDLGQARIAARFLAFTLVRCAVEVGALESDSGIESSPGRFRKPETQQFLPINKLLGLLVRTPVFRKFRRVLSIQRGKALNLNKELVKSLLESENPIETIESWSRHDRFSEEGLGETDSGALGRILIILRDELGPQDGAEGALGWLYSIRS